METKLFSTHSSDLHAAAALLRAGQLVAFPTETVYGLGAIVTNDDAVAGVYRAKGRPSDNPLIVTVSDAEMAMSYTNLTPEQTQLAQQLMSHFWPGSLTLVMPIKTGALSQQVTSGLATAAFRCPNLKATRDLIRFTGSPLVGPSANTSGKPSPTTAEHVYHDLAGKIAGIVNAGPTTVGLESSIVDISVATPSLLRPGAVTPTELKPFIPNLQTEHHHVGLHEIPKAPGMKYKHYAPDAQLLLVDPTADFVAVVQKALTKVPGDQVIGVLALDQQLALLPDSSQLVAYSLGTDITTASARLFAGLRYYDLHPQVRVALIQAVPEEGLGAAYMNRLRKAAGNQSYQAATFTQLL